MDAKEIIAWNLRHYRVLAGLSQERLALEAGIDRAYVGRIERGLENVTIERVQSLARVIGVTVGALFTAPPPDAEWPPSLRAGRKPAKSTPMVKE
jgi:transcriptional regulator with XRE-family HTH domain